MSKRLNQTIIIENKPGSGGTIGSQYVAQSTPDGSVLLLGSNATITLNPLLYPSIRYQPEKDFIAVAPIATLPYVIASNSKFDVNSIHELTKKAIEKPGSINYASAGNGTTNHLVGVLLENMSHTVMTHIPYRGASPAMNDVVSGVVNFMSGDLGTLMPMINAGKLKPLAVTSKQRNPLIPNVPSVHESIPGFEAYGWFGVFAPKQTPKATVDRLSDAVEKTLTDPSFIQRLNELGGSPLNLKGDEFPKMINRETIKWKKVIVDNKITAESLQ